MSCPLYTFSVKESLFGAEGAFLNKGKNMDAIAYMQMKTVYYGFLLFRGKANISEVRGAEMSSEQSSKKNDMGHIHFIKSPPST